MTARRISLPIEGATETECGGCAYASCLPYADPMIYICTRPEFAFFSPDGGYETATRPSDGERLPACLAAEAEHAALVRDARLGKAVREVLADFGWDHAVVRAEVESERALREEDR